MLSPAVPQLQMSSISNEEGLVLGYGTDLDPCSLKMCPIDLSTYGPSSKKLEQFLKYIKITIISVQINVTSQIL